MPKPLLGLGLGVLLAWTLPGRWLDVTWTQAVLGSGGGGGFCFNPRDLRQTKKGLTRPENVTKIAGRCPVLGKGFEA